jgi:hypothetical protein
MAVVVGAGGDGVVGVTTTTGITTTTAAADRWVTSAST